MKITNMLFVFGGLTLLSLTALAVTNYPVTVQDDYKQTKIQNKPKRIIAYHPIALEILLALNEQPIGYGGQMKGEKLGTPLKTIKGYNDLVKNEPIFVGFPINLETMVSIKSDLLVGNTSRKVDIDRQLRDKTPALLFEFGQQDSWRRAILPVAEALDKKELAAKYIKKVDQKYQAGQEKMKPVLNKGKNAVVFYLYGKQLFHASSGFAAAVPFKHLGFSIQGKGDKMKPVSKEALLSYQADHAILLTTNASPELLKDTLTFLKKGNYKGVYVVEPNRHAPYVVGPISEPKLIDHYVDVLTKNVQPK